MLFLSFLNSPADYPRPHRKLSSSDLAKIFQALPSRGYSLFLAYVSSRGSFQWLDPVSVHFKSLPRPSSYPALTLLTAIPIEARVSSNLPIMPSVVENKDSHNAEDVIEIEDSSDSASDTSDFNLGRPALSGNTHQGPPGQPQARPRGIPDCFKRVFDQW